MISYLEFTTQVRGYSFHDKKTGKQVYRYTMFWNGLTPVQCFKKYDTKIIIKSHNI
jgi:hypothetical protein